MADETVCITVRPNGPLRVEGHIVLKDADGGSGPDGEAGDQSVPVRAE